MTRAVSGTLASKFASTTTTLARLWTITRRDATVIRLTDHDQDLIVGGDTYYAAHGFTASSVLIASGAPVQGLEVSMPTTTANGIALADVLSGAFDKADCVLQYIDYEALAGGTMTLFGGVIGNADIDERRGQVSLQVEGLFMNTQRVRVESWSQTCRADLGDARCTVDIEALKTAITVTSFDSVYTFADSSLALADDAVKLGLVHWLTGNNAGLAFEIKGNISATDKITQFMPVPFAIQVGDTADVYPGCDKTITTCRVTYNNVINFRGEPFIPNGKMTV